MKGKLEKFIDDLPGMPDNIHHDGKGHYWIALATVIYIISLNFINYLFILCSTIHN